MLSLLSDLFDRLNQRHLGSNAIEDALSRKVSGQPSEGCIACRPLYLGLAVGRVVITSDLGVILPKTIVISIDAMGGDRGPSVIVPGITLALDALAGRSVRFLIHGDAAKIDLELAKTHAAKAASEVRHTALKIASEEKPAVALRRGKGSSLWNAVEAIRVGEADAAVSAGNTGALWAISKVILRMAGGLDRPQPSSQAGQQ